MYLQDFFEGENMDKEMAEYFRKRQALELKKKMIELCFLGVLFGTCILVIKWMF